MLKGQDQALSGFQRDAGGGQDMAGLCTTSSRAATRWTAWLFAALALAAAGPPALAEHDDEHFWNEPKGGLFGESQFWSPSSVPEDSDTAIFDLDAAFTVDFDANEASDRLLLHDGDVTFDLHGNKYSLINSNTLLSDSDASLTVGEQDGDDATLRLNDGVVTSVFSRIGYESGSQGSVIVGDGGTWDNDNKLLVGDEGNGTLTIQDGGTVLSGSFARIGSASGSHGTVTVDGDQSILELGGVLTVGDQGTGTLTIENGGAVSNTNGGIGQAGGSEGTVTVSGPQSTWDNSGSLEVGSLGEGTLIIEDGGAVSSTVGIIGFESGAQGTVTVRGEQSSWDTDGGYLSLGSFGGDGTLAIVDGGSVSNGDGYIGEYSGSTGVVTVAEEDSAWTNDGSLHVGGDDFEAGGSGELNILSGATVHVEDTLKVWDEGTVVLDGGTLRLDGYEREGDGEVDYQRGTIQLAGDRTIGDDSTIDAFFQRFRRTIDSDKGLVIEGRASLEGDLTVSGGVLTSEDSLSVGRETYEMSFTIENGGTVSSSGGYIGEHDGGAEVKVTGDESVWNMTDSLTVGGIADGTLTIEDGGAVSSTAARLGTYAPGTVTVAGDGSTWTSSESLYVGGYDSFSDGFDGTVNILPGASAYVEETLKIWESGELNLAGGTLRFDGYDRESSGTLNYLGGTVQLAGDRIIGMDDAVEDFFGTSPLIPTGKNLTVEGKATLLETLTIDGGTFAVGSLTDADQLDFQQGTVNVIGEGGMTVGHTGPFGDTLTLGESSLPQHLNVVHDGEDASTATVAGEGVVNIYPGSSFGGEQIDNFGEIRLLGDGARLNGDAINGDGGTVTNHGLIVGAGRVSATLDNQDAGEVRVMGAPDSEGNATPGRLVFTAEGNENRGAFNVEEGQRLEVLQDLTNEHDGDIFLGQDAVMHVNGGLTNHGGVTMHGNAEAHGTFTLTPDSSAEGEPSNAGRLSVVDNAMGKLFGDVINNGLVHVGDGSRITFLSDVTGSGDFSGSGVVEFADEFSPGNSPGAVSFGGDVSFTSGASLLMEVAGTEAGSEYDVLDITGEMTMDGALTVALLDDFAPELGDAFDLFDFTGVEGEFADVILPELDGGLMWDDSAFYSTGTLSVAVPEPGSLALLGLSGLALLRRRSNRRGPAWPEDDLPGRPPRQAAVELCHADSSTIWPRVLLAPRDFWHPFTLIKCV